MFFIGRGSARQVIENYNHLIGHNYIPPYWSFGYHQ